LKNLIKTKEMKKAEFIYSTTPVRLKKFFNKIQSMGIPEKLTRNFLLKVGFKSSSDRVNIKILKALGFTDSDNIPTQRWKDYRTENKAKYVIAEAIHEYYAELFKLYPKGKLLDDQNLNNFFKGASNLGHSAISSMVGTFNVLYKELAGFETKKLAHPRIKNSHDVYTEESLFSKSEPLLPPEEKIKETEDEITEEKKSPNLEIPSMFNNINVNINLHPNVTLKQIEEFLKSIAKHR